MIPVGKVDFSDSTQVWWRIIGDEWLARKGGEYHTVELPDGKIALLRWMEARSDVHGSICRSLYLGAVANKPGKLLPIDIPAKKETPIKSADYSILQGTFWGDPNFDLQIRCLTNTGDRIWEWLFLPIKQMRRHLGVFAQSGSGKSYAVGKLIEELFSRLLARKKRAHILILDPNGDFRNFSDSKVDSNILENIDLTFRGALRYIPNLSWDEWVKNHIEEWKDTLKKSKSDSLFPKPYPNESDPLVTWHVVDLQDDEDKQKSAINLNEIKRRLFDRQAPPTFIVIDEAHNVVPRESLIEGNINDCQGIVNKIAAEGRKFEAFLIIISQSPSKIHPNTLSQCGNLILMKTTTFDDIKTICQLRTDIPKELIKRAAKFGRGDALFMGDFVPAPVTARIVGRISEEGDKV